MCLAACSASSTATEPLEFGADAGADARREDASVPGGDARAGRADSRKPATDAPLGPPDGGAPFRPLESLGQAQLTLYYGIYAGDLYAVYDSGWVFPLSAGGSAQAATFGGAWPDLRESGATAVVGRDLYLVGGGGDGIITQWEDDEWDYVDLSARVYKTGGSSPAFAHFLAAAVYGTSIYAIGGDLQEHGPTGSAGVLVLDTTTGVWSTGTPLPVPRSMHGAAVLGTTLLVAGGVCGGSPACPGGASGDVLLDSTVTLDVSSPSASWQPGPNLPAAIEALSLVATSSRFYALGGTTADDSAFNWEKILSWAPGEASWRVEGVIPSGIGALGLLSTATELVLVDFTHAQIYVWAP